MPPGSPFSSPRLSSSRGDCCPRRTSSPPQVEAGSSLRRINGLRKPSVKRTLPAEDRLDSRCDGVPPGVTGTVDHSLGAPLDTVSQNPSSTSLPGAQIRGRDRGEPKVHRRKTTHPNLVWIRKDLFLTGEFSAADCYPIGASDHLPQPKQFSFSRDYWSRKTGKIPFVAIARGMAGGGRNQSTRGGRYGAGRGRNSGRPPAPTRTIRPTTPAVVPPIHPPPAAQPLPMSIYAKPPIFPMSTAPPMPHPGGQAFVGFPGGWNNQYQQIGPWPQ